MSRSRSSRHVPIERVISACWWPDPATSGPARQSPGEELEAQEIPGGVEGKRQVSALDVHDQDRDGVGGLEPDFGQRRGARGQGAFEEADELPVRAARDPQELVKQITRCDSAEPWGWYLGR